ncbi:MAG: DUF2752 domain-containing protein [Actinobacteria bacterium]|nr:DUF2752 domain-containing protein [Actinomycetota bacterium]
MPTAARAHRPPWVRPAATGAGVAAATLVLAVGDPNTTHVPLCPLHALTGLDCPFCGSLRAVHALAHLDVASAASHNLLFTLAAPLLVAGWVVWMAASLGHPVGARLGWSPRREPGPRPLPRSATWAFWLVVVAFGVARNLPALGWLASGA